MERLWSLAGATSGNPWQIGRPRKRRNQAKTVATGCDQLPWDLDGKEGVDGSSPSEGLKSLQISHLCCLYWRRYQVPVGGSGVTVDGRRCRSFTATLSSCSRRVRCETLRQGRTEVARAFRKVRSLAATDAERRPGMRGRTRRVVRGAARVFEAGQGTITEPARCRQCNSVRGRTPFRRSRPSSRGN